MDCIGDQSQHVFIELIGGAYAHSSSLWADSLDFFGDAVNYGISLAVLSASLYWRATVALVKGITMALFGVVVMGKVIVLPIYRVFHLKP